MKEEVLRILTDHGTLIEPDAVNFILSQKDPKAFIKAFLEEREALPLVLSLKDFRTTESVLSYSEEEEAVAEPVEEDDEIQTTLPEAEEAEPEEVDEEDNPPSRKTVPARQPKTELRKGRAIIITDITGNSTCEGKIDNFARYFKDRYVTLNRIIRQWQRMRSVMPVERALKREDEVRIIGMVNEISQTKNGHTIITVEDDTSKIDALILKGSPCQSIPLIKDEVVGLIGQVKKRKGGFKGNGDSIMLFPDEIIKPDIPVNRAPRRADENVEAIFVSDIHVGSSHFLAKEWDNFISWLADGDNSARIRYMVIAGDLVDGIGIYPNQQEELEIDDITEQYATLSRLLEKVPQHIEIIAQPGNHDAVRPAEPQPALDSDLQALFENNKNMRFAGNPCFMSLDGVSVLSYHGRSVDDFIGDIPQLTYQTPILAMKEMLTRRHMAPIYGGKTPLAPEDKDYMIINPVPDIFVTGHVHGAGTDNYRGVTMINASAWQSQTPFQLMHNFHPDPAKVYSVNLMTGATRLHDFSLADEGEDEE